MIDRLDLSDSVGIGLPDVWTEFPLERGEFEARLDGLLRVLESEAVPVQQRREVELLHRQLLDGAEDAQLVIAASMFARSEEEDASGAPSLVAASAGVSAQTREQLGSPGALTIGLLERAVTEDESARDLEPPRRVDLPVGKALRTQRLHKMRAAPGVSVPFIGQSYLVPIDGGERLLTIQFATPNVELREVFAELFEAIARTVRVFRPGEATTFDDPTPATDGEDDG